MPSHPHREAHHRARSALRKMSSKERDELLKRAGILGEDGRLADRYRPPEKVPERDSIARRG